MVAMILNRVNQHNEQLDATNPLLEKVEQKQIQCLENLLLGKVEQN
jgi:hypothetical protein